MFAAMADCTRVARKHTRRIKDAVRDWNEWCRESGVKCLPPRYERNLRELNEKESRQAAFMFVAAIQILLAGTPDPAKPKKCPKKRKPRAAGDSISAESYILECEDITFRLREEDIFF